MRPRGPRRPSAGKWPRLARPGPAPRGKAKAGQGRRCPRQSGQAAGLSSGRRKPRLTSFAAPLPQTDRLFGLCSRLGASDARLRPPLSHNPLAQGHAGSPAYPPPSGCEEAARPGRAVRLRAGPNHTPLAQPKCGCGCACVGLGQRSPGINADNPTRRRHCPRVAFLYDSVPKSRINPAPGFLFPLAPFGNPLALRSPPIISLLWL